MTSSYEGHQPSCQQQAVMAVASVAAGVVAGGHHLGVHQVQPNFQHQYARHHHHQVHAVTESGRPLHSSAADEVCL